MSDNQTAGISAGELESLEGKKLHELQTIAKSIGIKRVTGIRKVQLIESIREKAQSSDAPKSSAKQKNEDGSDSTQKDSELMRSCRMAMGSCVQ